MQPRMGRNNLAQQPSTSLRAGYATGGVLGSTGNEPESLGDGIWSSAAALEELALFREVPQQKRAIVDAMLARRLNCFDTSSCGRLFDAVSSIVGLRHEVTFEGQAAIELEMIADPAIERVYLYEITGDGPAQLDMRPMIEAIVRDHFARSTRQAKSRPPFTIRWRRSSSMSAPRFANAMASIACA